jgi:hypothetical protein
VKLLYRPFGLIVSILGAVVAGQVFNRLWALASDADGVPKPKQRDRSWAEVVGGAALHGAVYGGVKALIDRAGRTGYAKATGTWPGPNTTT